MAARDALQAGAASVEITPPAGTQLAGAVGYHRPPRVALDPLQAKAVALKTDRCEICVVAIDVTIITEEWTEYIREQVYKLLGIERDAIMVHATQTHSAPPIGHFMLDPDFPELPEEFEWVRGGDEAFSKWAADRAVEAIVRAAEDTEPAEIAVASGSDGRWAANRRAVTMDGGITMVTRSWEAPSAGQTIRFIEGPTDPEVGVMALRRGTLDVPALLLHHTCHPVCVFPRPLVSADWPGAWAAQMRAILGDRCVPLVINGACGNINPADRSDHRAMGRGLAETTEMVLPRLEFSGEAILQFRRIELPIPLRELTDDELSWAQGVLESDPEPPWDPDRPGQLAREWIEAASTWSVHLQRQRNPNLSYEIQVLRIGDTAIVGLPGEPFVELGLAVKMASPFRPTFIAHCTSHYVGYIPTAEALARGGHESVTRYWAKLVPEAFEMIRGEATRLLREIAGDG
ncbi:MAG: hypothetical protein ACOX9R_00480 [Armatimonadota bacterium]|jgi:neutral ceramidase